MNWMRFRLAGRSRHIRVCIIGERQERTTWLKQSCSQQIWQAGPNSASRSGNSSEWLVIHKPENFLRLHRMIRASFANISLKRFYCSEDSSTGSRSQNIWSSGMPITTGRTRRPRSGLEIRTAPTSGRLSQHCRAISTPPTKNAVESASATAADEATTVTDSVPSTGQPVRGSRM